MKYVWNLLLPILNVNPNYYRYMVIVFMDLICGIYTARNLWNVAKRKLYSLPVQTHYRYLMHISQQNHIDNVLKCRFIKFMVGNIRSKNLFVSHIAKVCFKNVSTISGCTVSKILNKYGVDFIKLDTPHGTKDEMALQYRITLSDCIKGEEWKIDMITEIFDCINGIYELNRNEEKKLFLLNDLYTL